MSHLPGERMRSCPACGGTGAVRAGTIKLEDCAGFDLVLVG